ncbi:SEC12-like protein 1 isoform X2 [Malania oleifera]|uniref:SEC12-like protein 1 isoform X2 n=1 Tax=Malania oleifera TaxID=397392 RepID=UPI0025AE1162|nr:SEC12-like protein 1 isoform X2 [Malania oleifera]
MEGEAEEGSVVSASWIRRPENAHLMVTGRSMPRGSPPSTLQIFSFDAKTTSLSSSPKATCALEDGELVTIAVHPSGDNIVCSTTAGGCRLDSEFLASTSTDGSARIWKTNEGFLTSLTRSSDEKIDLCRFSKDGTKPFLFCTVQKGDKAVTAVWDMSTWNKIGHKRLLRKRASILSVSTDGKYLALGSKDGDICVVEVKKMAICHWSKRLHAGTCIASLEFCPSERVVLTASSLWGTVVTKLNVPADWKEWQIYLLLLGLFLASTVVFYIFFENSDSFWNFPLRKTQPARPNIEAILGDPQSDDQNMWGPFGPLDM